MQYYKTKLIYARCWIYRFTSKWVPGFGRLVTKRTEAILKSASHDVISMSLFIILAGGLETSDHFLQTEKLALRMH